MSSGPGILQNKILSTLQKYPSYIFQNIILWELAFERNEIAEEEEIYRDLKSGYIKKSFQENFRRAVRRLIETKKVVAHKRKITDLNEAFQNFPYFTSRLDIHLLRKKLLPGVLDYINNEPFFRPFGIAEIEEYQSKNFSKRKRYLINKKWHNIERKIALILTRCNQTKFELWLNCLARGRYLFSGSKLKRDWALVNICSEIEKNSKLGSIEKDTLIEIRKLMKSNFTKTDWELGNLKSIYYSISVMSKRSSGRLNDDVKRYLRREHEDLVTCLPDHKEREKLPTNFRGKKTWMHYGEIKYSPLLDKLLTKQILRNFTFIKLSS